MPGDSRDWEERDREDRANERSSYQEWAGIYIDEDGYSNDGAGDTYEPEYDEYKPKDTDSYQYPPNRREEMPEQEKRVRGSFYNKEVDNHNAFSQLQ